MSFITRLIAVAALVVAFGTTAHRADAAPVFYAFQLNPLGGGAPVGSGTLTIDETLWTGVGAKTFDPQSGLLSFDTTVNGLAFDINDDVAYPLFPSVSLNAGIISAISYAGIEAGGAVLSIAGLGYEFISAAGVTAAGTLQVPEGSGLLAVATGLLLAGGLVRRRARG